MDKRTVLLVEDNERLNEVNRRALESAGYEVFTALTLASAREHLERVEPRVILLDVMLPDGDGMDFCNEIREKTKADIIFLTLRREHESMLRGLALGGDDYIAKPFKLDELLQRVASAMRRQEMHAAPVKTLEKGGLTLDILALQAFVDGNNLGLSPKEFMLLLLFAQNEDKTMSAEHLYEEVWKTPMAGDKNAVQTAVSKLRKKIEATDYDIFITRGKGYTFERK